MPDHEIDALARAAHRRRRLPPDAVCATCATSEQLSRRPDGRVLCYADLRVETGASPVEEDHIAGRVNLGGLVVRLRANDHRTVTELRTQLGADEWPRADGDPLLTLAHFLHGLGTLLIVLARWLVELAADAARRLGPSGWEGAPPAPIVP
jgi:hypothetical protein